MVSKISVFTGVSVAALLVSGAQAQRSTPAAQAAPVAALVKSVDIP